MIPELVPVAHYFQLGDTSLDRLVGDFVATDWTTRDATGHDARWIVGHLALMRHRCLGLMGVPARDPEWQAAVARGSSPDAVPDSVTGPDFVAAFHDFHEAMAGRWDALAPPLLAADLGRRLADGSDTVGGALRFLAWHETYHLGQLGLLRRLVGKPGLA